MVLFAFATANFLDFPITNSDVKTVLSGELQCISGRVMRE
jgi:hypothetical protein